MSVEDAEWLRYLRHRLRLHGFRGRADCKRVVDERDQRIKQLRLEYSERQQRSKNSVMKIK